MKRINRRDLIASLAAYSTLAASQSALACDVSRARREGFSTKSYACNLGSGQRLTTTFLRVCDVLFDSAGRTQLPGVFGDYQELVVGHRLIETPALKTFEYLLGNHSFSFEPINFFLQFDGRANGQQIEIDSYSESYEYTGGRWRTLGVWDNPDFDNRPLFPLPRELRKAMQSGQDYDLKFWRYARSSDFDSLNSKIEEYLALWGTHLQGGIDVDELGNLSLLRHIRAGSVDGFLPLFLSSDFGISPCGAEPYGGAHYAPPALYLDVAICKNDGASNVRIDDFFGATDTQEQLRAYSSSTPTGATPFGWNSVELEPGESVLIVQRLLFGAQPFSAIPWADDGGEKITPRRAVFGQTHLPKGVLVDGNSVSFDGRSHNSLIIGSYYDKGSCPYLYSWCDQTREWVLLGKILTDCIGADRTGAEQRRFFGLRHRFKLVEREHERSTLLSYKLKLELRSGEIVHLSHKIGKTVLNIGENLDFAFDVPENVAPSDVVSTELTVRGYYEKYTFDDLASRAKALEQMG